MVNYCYRDLKKAEIVKEFASQWIPICTIVLLIITLAITCIIFIISGDLIWEAPLSIFLYLIALLIHDYIIGIEPIVDNVDSEFLTTIIFCFFVGGVWVASGGVILWSWLSSNPVNVNYEDCGIVSFALAPLQMILTLFCIWREHKASTEEEQQTEEEEINPLHISDDGKSLMWCDRDARTCVIPEGIEEIGAEAFRSCSNISSLTIPDSVKAIGKGAFQASGINRIKLPKSITRIEERTFAVCRKLEEIELPNTVETICFEAFNNCESLKRIVIPPSVKEIESYAISGCSNLREVVIEGFPIIIHNWAFYDCRELVQIVLAAPMHTDSWTFRCSEYLHYVFSNHGKGKLI